MVVLLISLLFIFFHVTFTLPSATAVALPYNSNFDPHASACNDVFQEYNPATAARGGCHYNENEEYTVNFMIFDLQSAPIPATHQLQSWEHSTEQEFLVDSRTFRERRINKDPADKAVYWVFYVDPSKSRDLPTNADNRIISFTPAFANGVTGSHFVKADCFDTEPEYRVIKTDGEAILTGVDATFAYQEEGIYYDNILNPDYSHLKPSILLWAVYGPPVPVSEYLPIANSLPSTVDNCEKATAQPGTEIPSDTQPNKSAPGLPGFVTESKVPFVILALVIISSMVIFKKSRRK